MNDDLRQAVMIAQVNEEDAAMVALTEDPTRDADGFAGIGGTQFVARMCTVRMHKGSLSVEKSRNTVPHYAVKTKIPVMCLGIGHFLSEGEIGEAEFVGESIFGLFGTSTRTNGQGKHETVAESLDKRALFGEEFGIETVQVGVEVGNNT